MADVVLTQIQDQIKGLETQKILFLYILNFFIKYECLLFKQ